MLVVSTRTTARYLGQGRRAGGMGHPVSALPIAFDGQFILYSVGWNEKDDGGVPGKTLFDEKEGDWVRE